MGRRLFLLATTCWALVVSPSLCLGGVLLHPCDPVSDATAPATECHVNQHEERHDADGGSCSHEGGCSADPCEETPVVKDTSDTGLAACELVPVFCGVLVSELPQAFRRLPADADALRRRPNLALHESDLPFLI